MRLGTPTARTTSVPRRRSVRERSPPPITRLDRLMSASTAHASGRLRSSASVCGRARRSSAGGRRPVTRLHPDPAAAADPCNTAPDLSCNDAIWVRRVTAGDIAPARGAETASQRAAGWGDHRMRSRRRWLHFATPFAALALGAVPARAQTAPATQTGGYERLTTIAIPGKPLLTNDLSFVDPVFRLYYLADRTNAGIDVVDTRTNRFLFRVTGTPGVSTFVVSLPTATFPARTGSRPQASAGSGPATATAPSRSSTSFPALWSGPSPRAAPRGWTAWPWIQPTTSCWR